MPDSVDRPLPPEIGAAVDTALSGLERTIPGVSTDPRVRGEVQAAVTAALASLDRQVPEATEAGTRRALEVFESPALAGLAAPEGSTATATRQAIEALGSAAYETGPHPSGS